MFRQTRLWFAALLVLGAITVASPAGAFISDGADDSLSEAPPIETCIDDFQQGTPAGETLIGTSDCDYLAGNAGHDYLYGAATGDWLYGGPGGDVIYGEGGADYVVAGCRTSICGGYADLLDGGPGADILGGDNGYFTIFYGGDGYDICFYDAGDDINFGCEKKWKDGVLQP